MRLCQFCIAFEVLSPSSINALQNQEMSKFIGGK